MTKEACACQCAHVHDPRYDALDNILSRYSGQKGMLIPVMHEAQQLFGYLPEDVQQKIADGMEVPLSEVYGVATFYSLFSLRPAGVHTIGVCMGTACYVRGAAAVLAELQKQLDVKVDDTTEDGKFTLEVRRCLGACGLAPVIMIDDEVYGRLTPEKVKDILAKY
jgi:NADP-reducing hydrogenase subunit HndA